MSAPPPDPPGGPSAEAPPRAAQILLVDDEPSVLNALRRLFRPTGHEVRLAGSGPEALDCLSQQPIDLVLSDMRMPGMSGAELLQAVREHDPSISRVLLTGYADIGATVAAINQGEIHRYVAKPWNDQELLLVVNDMLARRQLAQDNARLQALTTEQNETLKRFNQTLEQQVASRTAELQQLNAMLERAFDDLNHNFTLAISVFTSLMEMRQGSFAGHSRRVALLARAIGERMGLTARALQEVYLAGLLHDVGKMGFPDRMLGTPLPLMAPEDLGRYRRHSVDGETTLMALDALQGVARIVRQHHERVDGHGFPDGLAGEAILLGARIVAVANDHDALIQGSLSERPYSPLEAQQALRGGVGTRYDAQVVEAALVELAAQAQADSDDLLIDARELKPGMVLAQDLLSARGSLLLAAGHRFDPHIVRQVTEYAQREQVRLVLRVRRDSLPADLPLRSPAAA